jgi:hypothetical protein
MLHVIYKNLFVKKENYEEIVNKTSKYVADVPCNHLLCEKEYCIHGCWEHHCSGCGRGTINKDFCENHDCFYSVNVQNNLENLLNTQEVEGKIVSLKAGLFQLFNKKDLITILKIIKKEDPSLTISGCLVDYRKNV